MSYVISELLVCNNKLETKYNTISAKLKKLCVHSLPTIRIRKKEVNICPSNRVHSLPIRIRNGPNRKRVEGKGIGS